jgi:hypothetical protein
VAPIALFRQAILSLHVPGVGITVAGECATSTLLLEQPYPGRRCPLGYLLSRGTPDSQRFCTMVSSQPLVGNEPSSQDDDHGDQFEAGGVVK